MNKCILQSYVLDEFIQYGVTWEFLCMPKSETKPHIQELSVSTTIISRYAFTAVSCTMINRHSAASEAVFMFHIPAAAYISNFTMIVGGRVFPSQIKAKEKKLKKDKKENNGMPKNKDSAEH
ncbi:inter-alpha-trypsin inhibitor heavy chain H5 isoform X1, partial [Tachysurus ichikawai]